MDNSNTSKNSITPPIERFGLSAFGAKERQQFGQNVRLAMACIEGAELPTSGKAMPSEVPAIRKRLVSLTQELTSGHADVLELLVRFDDLQGWTSSGARHCAAWIDQELGISAQLGWEYLRVGRELRKLPTTRALFRAGKLGWSKVRCICRVANPDNEKLLCHTALDASVAQVDRLCAAYRWNEHSSDVGSDNNGENTGNTEDQNALQQWETRSLTDRVNSNGSISIRITLPPESAQAFLNSVEHSMNQLSADESTLSQRRADAALLMAENSLQQAGKEIASADRYQVIVSVDESELQSSNDSAQAVFDPLAPPKKPSIQGAGPIAKETARRIACDCSISTNRQCEGELMSIGRKSRIWTASMTRAIKQRDNHHCQFPGCCQNRHLQIHHIKHWADGGETSVSNGVTVCAFHHRLLHEGGYSIERTDTTRQRLDEQFERQRKDHDVTQFAFEKEVRGDRQLFDASEKLSPTRYRVIDADGQEVNAFLPIDKHPTFEKQHTHTKQHTRIDCAEPAAVYNAALIPDRLFLQVH